MKKTKQELDFHPVKTPKIVVFSSSWSLWALLCTYLSSLFRQTNVSFQFWHWLDLPADVRFSFMNHGTPAGNDLEMIWSSGFLLFKHFIWRIFTKKSKFFVKSQYSRDSRRNVKLKSLIFRQIAKFWHEFNKKMSGKAKKFVKVCLQCN